MRSTPPPGQEHKGIDASSQHLALFGPETFLLLSSENGEGATANVERRTENGERRTENGEPKIEKRHFRSRFSVLGSPFSVHHSCYPTGGGLDEFSPSVASMWKRC